MTRKEIIASLNEQDPFLTNQALVSRVIVQELLELQLSPGDKISQSQLAADFNLSRGPVKTALEKLTKDGFLVQDSAGAFYARRLSPYVTQQILSFKRQLDLLALNDAAFNIAKADEAAMLRELELMEQAIQMKDTAMLCKSDIRFHVALVRTSKNPLLTETYYRYKDLFQYSAISNNSDGMFNKQLLYVHRKILSSIRRQDTDAARAAVNNHYSTLFY